MQHLQIYTQRGQTTYAPQKHFDKFGLLSSHLTNLFDMGNLKGMCHQQALDQSCKQEPREKFSLSSKQTAHCFSQHETDASVQIRWKQLLSNSITSSGSSNKREENNLRTTDLPSRCERSTYPVSIQHCTMTKSIAVRDNLHSQQSSCTFVHERNQPNYFLNISKHTFP